MPSPPVTTAKLSAPSSLRVPKQSSYSPPKDAQGLADATPTQLSVIEISGFGIHFPKLEADLYAPSLLEGLLGSRKWMASRLGAKGAKSRSTGKAPTARANGTLGGRPRKLAIR